MLLACVGIYGVMAYGVTRRTSEIGVRMALGAVPRDVVRMVLRETLLLAASGIAIGLPAAWWLSRQPAARAARIDPTTALRYE